MKLLLQLTFNGMLVADSMVISLGQERQEEINQHLCWQDGVNLVVQLTPLDLI